ncbi:MAG: albusnodin family lasso peptide [Pseudonocardiales bacterium]
MNGEEVMGMSKYRSMRARRPCRQDPAGLRSLGDAATLTKGGSGGSSEQKRFPYG